MPFVLFSEQDGLLLGDFVLESSEWLCPGTSPKVAGTVGETNRGSAGNMAFPGPDSKQSGDLALCRAFTWLEFGDSGQPCADKPRETSLRTVLHTLLCRAARTPSPQI